MMYEVYNNFHNKCNIMNIKSNYILMRIFYNLKRNILLKLIKYNRKIQKRLNKDKDDYKNYSQIEIEIICKNNSIKIFNGKEDYKPFYHIILDDNKNENANVDNSKEDTDKKIIIKLDYEIKSLNRLFMNCYEIKEVNFVKFIRKDIVEMSYMFFNCSSLEKIIIPKIYTNNVINMSYMFYGCSSLQNLDVSTLNTDKVIDMNNMFSGCSSLQSLNLSNFNTNNVTNMSYMFYGCKSLLTLDISKFNIDNVEDYYSMFNSNNSLEELIISSSIGNNYGIMKEIKTEFYSLKKVRKLKPEIKQKVDKKCISF